MRLDRLKKIYDNFKMNVSTNGIIPIPKDGFENMPIGVSVWGDHDTDAILRSNGKQDIFSIALHNYKNDSRAFWYYTVSAGNAHEIEDVANKCVANGNRILFNFYSDINNVGGTLDHQKGFAIVRKEIDKVIRHLNRMISLSELREQQQLAEMKLLQRGNRLSVLPLSKDEWDFILSME